MMSIDQIIQHLPIIYPTAPGLPHPPLEIPRRIRFPFRFLWDQTWLVRDMYTDISRRLAYGRSKISRVELL